MFGTDTNNQSTASDQSATMGLASAPSQPSSTPEETPTLSNDYSDTSADNSSVQPTSSVPEFVPPDANGNITQNTDFTAKFSGDLASIKKDALEKLGPLVDKLDQTPEEKFKTIMMMIQASDDQALVSKAYEIANSISNETIKARALLDIINEINYFTNQTTEEDK